MIRLLMIADDFTGALDTGVQFAARGAQTRVVTGPDFNLAAAEGDVLVLDAETRHMAPKDAYAAVYRVAVSAREAEIPFVYKKTDSALRGNIGGELAAVMDGLGRKRCAFVPAFPAMRRTTRKGIHYVEGVPVAESVFGQDPFEPVRFSSVQEIIAQQTDKPVWSCAPRRSGMAGLDVENGIQVYDAETDEDLLQIGRTLGLEGLRLSAGCAGFASALAGLLGLDGQPPRVPALPHALFLFCGSVNPVTRAQVRAAQGCGFQRFFLGEEPSKDAMMEAARSGRAILDANEGDNPPADGDPAAVADALASWAKKLLDNKINATLMCVGGDTLMALMRAVGVNALTPVCELAKGVVLTCFIYKEKPYYILSKSGGFGEPDLLCRLAERIGA